MNVNPTWTFSDPDPGDLERCLTAWDVHCVDHALTFAITPARRLCRAFSTPAGLRGIELHNGDRLLARYFFATNGRVTLSLEIAEQVEK